LDFGVLLRRENHGKNSARPAIGAGKIGSVKHFTSLFLTCDKLFFSAEILAQLGNQPGFAGRAEF
jgi:hypothetical protein